MATAQLASMLDELMGRNRNVAPNENVRELRWSDPEVCKYYVVEFCPHDLFTNTKADLGPCHKIHDDELKRRFEEEEDDSPRKKQHIDDFLRFAHRMLTELQARIKKAKERLHLTQNDDVLPASASGQHKDTEEKIQLLGKRISALVEEAEAAGCQGNVEQAQGLMKLSDQLREERESLRRTIMPFLKEEYSLQPQKAMEVCDTCGAFLIVGDAQQRIDDHLMGKQHIGYARLRVAVDKIEDSRRKQREERDREAEERRKKRQEEEDAGRKEQRHRRSSSSAGRRRRSRSRDRRRSRSRDRRRRRSRSRERSGRGRSRSRETRRRPQRSRSPRPRRSRSRDEHRRRRSSSRERRRRSRSRDRRSSDHDRGNGEEAK